MYQFNTTETKDLLTKAIDFAPDGEVGTSNKATGPISLMADCPKMLAVMPLDCLNGVLEALEKAPKWPIVRN